MGQRLLTIAKAEAREGVEHVRPLERLTSRSRREALDTSCRVTDGAAPTMN